MLFRKRWGGLFQQVARLPHISLPLWVSKNLRAALGDNHIVCAANMAKNYTPLSYKNYNPITMFVFNEDAYICQLSKTPTQQIRF